MKTNNAKQYDGSECKSQLRCWVREDGYTHVLRLRCWLATLGAGLEAADGCTYERLCYWLAGYAGSWIRGGGWLHVRLWLEAGLEAVDGCTYVRLRCWLMG